MNAALELFLSTGYTKTMIVDIVGKVGVAKGTFYYYFPSKEAILAALFSRWATEKVAVFKLENSQAAVQKLQSFIKLLFFPPQSPLNNLFYRLWHEKQSHLLYKTWHQVMKNIFNPVLADIIRQGNQEGTMHVACPKETLDFFWSTLNCLWQSACRRDAPVIFTDKIEITEVILEKILGIEEGTLVLNITHFVLR